MNFIERNGIIVGFRPEAFSPAEAASRNGQMEFTFRVTRVENLGSHKLAYGTIGETVVVANLPLRISLEEGREYEFIVPLKDVRYYDSVTGTRIKKESFEGTAVPGLK